MCLSTPSLLACTCRSQGAAPDSVAPSLPTCPLSGPQHKFHPLQGSSQVSVPSVPFHPRPPPIPGPALASGQLSAQIPFPPVILWTILPSLHTGPPPLSEIGAFSAPHPSPCGLSCKAHPAPRTLLLLPKPPTPGCSCLHPTPDPSLMISSGPFQFLQ